VNTLSDTELQKSCVGITHFSRGNKKSPVAVWLVYRTFRDAGLFFREHMDMV